MPAAPNPAASNPAVVAAAPSAAAAAVAPPPNPANIPGFIIKYAPPASKANLPILLLTTDLTALATPLTTFPIALPIPPNK